MMKAAFRAILVSAAVTTMATASAQAAHVTRAWHVDRADPDSTLCRESGGARTIITTGPGSTARYDDPTQAEWQRAGCEASRPHRISRAEALRHLNEQTAEMTRPLDFSRDILPLMQKLAARNATAQGQAPTPAQ